MIAMLGCAAMRGPGPAPHRAVKRLISSATDPPYVARFGAEAQNWPTSATLRGWLVEADVDIQEKDLISV